MNWFKPKEVVFPDEINIQDNSYEMEVVFSKKKNSSVQVKDNKLIFRLSTYLSKKKANEHFNELLKNIAEKIKKSPKKQKKQFKEVLELGEFTFSNTLYKLEHTHKIRGVKLIDNTFYINPHTKLENIEKHILKLLTSTYLGRLKEYVSVLNEQTYNYGIKDFQLKLLNSKWGHCTHDNIIMLNLKLLNADPEIMNYVIFHELAHIKVKNHSVTFWREVERFCPNYKVLRKALKGNPPEVYV